MGWRVVSGCYDSWLVLPEVGNGRDGFVGFVGFVVVTGGEVVHCARVRSFFLFFRYFGVEYCKERELGDASSSCERWLLVCMSGPYLVQS